MVFLMQVNFQLQFKSLIIFDLQQSCNLNAFFKLSCNRILASGSVQVGNYLKSFTY